MIVNRLKIVAQRCKRLIPFGRVPQTRALERSLRRLGTLRNCRHAAIGQPHGIDGSVVGQCETERRHHRRNILVETLGDLVAAELVIVLQQRHRDRGHELSRLAILTAVVDEKILQLDEAHVLALAQVNRGPKCDQHRRYVSDRRSIGDITADRAARADLLGTKAPHHFTDVGIKAAKMRFRLAAGCARADDQFVAGVLDHVQPLGPTHMNDLR